MSRWTDHRTEPTRCPYCGHTLDCASSEQGGDKPEPGDVSICLGCAGLLVFGDDGRTRKPTGSETFAILMSADWPTVDRMRKAAMRAIHEDRRKKGRRR